MASQQQLQQYLSYWFQAGKGVSINNGQETLLPRPVIQGDRYSPEFESCWQRIHAANPEHCHLEGTDQTIAELATDKWDISPCSRCAMPVPIAAAAMPSINCPCADMPTWPNLTIPQPHGPLNDRTQMVQICDRLLRLKSASSPQHGNLAASR